MRIWVWSLEPSKNQVSSSLHSVGEAETGGFPCLLTSQSIWIVRFLLQLKALFLQIEKKPDISTCVRAHTHTHHIYIKYSCTIHKGGYNLLKEMDFFILLGRSSSSDYQNFVHYHDCFFMWSYLIQDYIYFRVRNPLLKHRRKGFSKAWR